MTDETTGGGAVTFGSVLAQATPARKRYRLCVNGALVDEIETLERDLVNAKALDEMSNEPDQAPAIAARIVELTEKAQSTAVDFVFQAIGRRAWSDLVAKHPPTDEDRAKNADYNRETFPVAAMAASCVEPTGATVEGFEQLRDSDAVGQRQWNSLWWACLEANIGGSDIPLSEDAYRMVRGTDSKLESPAPTASPAASS